MARKFTEFTEIPDMLSLRQLVKTLQDGGGDVFLVGYSTDDVTNLDSGDEFRIPVDEFLKLIFEETIISTNEDIFEGDGTSPLSPLNLITTNTQEGDTLVWREGKWRVERLPTAAPIEYSPAGQIRIKPPTGGHASTGMSLRWDGSQWVADWLTISTTGPLTGTGTATNPVGLPDASPTNVNHTLVWDGSQWAVKGIDLVTPLTYEHGTYGKIKIRDGSSNRDFLRWNPLVAGGRWQVATVSYEGDGITITGDGESTPYTLTEPVDKTRDSTLLYKTDGSGWTHASPTNFFPFVDGDVVYSNFLAPEFQDRAVFMDGPLVVKTILRDYNEADGQNVVIDLAAANLQILELKNTTGGEIVNNVQIKNAVPGSRVSLLFRLTEDSTHKITLGNFILVQPATNDPDVIDQPGNYPVSNLYLSREFTFSIEPVGPGEDIQTLEIEAIVGMDAVYVKGVTIYPTDL